MKKEMFKKLTALAICGIMLVLPTLSFAADGFITPWNSTYNFDSTTFDFTNDTETTDLYPDASTYDYMSTYSTVYGIVKGCQAVVRDSYKDGETIVYDNVTGTQGNKYLFFDNNRTVAGRPGYFFHNLAESETKYTKGNGGICHGKVTYELDLRLNNITKSDYNGVGTVDIFALSNNKRTAFIKVKMQHGDKGSYYFQAYDTDSKKYAALGSAIDKDKWCHLKITYEVGTNNVKYELYQYDDGQMTPKATKEWGLENASLVNEPVFTTVRVAGSAWCDTSIDNVSVTKETFAIGDKNITTDDSNVTATVKIANDVYADAKVGTAIATTSPKVILATYGENDALINANFADVEFTGHEISQKPDDMTAQEFFTKALDYKDVTVTVPKTSDMLNAKVFVWNNMTDMFPYISAE